MEEPEIPMEHLQEPSMNMRTRPCPLDFVGGVEHSHLAVLAAIAGLLSGSHANEAMMSQIDAADQWGFYQAKSIKAAIFGNEKFSFLDINGNGPADKLRGIRKKKQRSRAERKKNRPRPRRTSQARGVMRAA